MQKTYELACSFLRSMLPDQLSESDLNKYFIGDSRDFTSIQDIYERFIYSAQNYQGMPNVIKYHQRREVIKRILCNFDVVNIQNMEVEKLYQKFRKEFNVTSKDTKRNSWRKWSFSIIDTAKFISNFKSVDDFRGFVERFNYNRLTRMALPLLISTITIDLEANSAQVSSNGEVKVTQEMMDRLEYAQELGEMQMVEGSTIYLCNAKEVEGSIKYYETVYYGDTTEIEANAGVCNAFNVGKYLHISE